MITQPTPAPPTAVQTTAVQTTATAPVGRAHVYRGHVFHVAGAPTVQQAADHLVSIPDGALVTTPAGGIAWVGDFARLPAAYVALPLTDTHGGFILPGFVDTHLHYP